MLTCWVCAAQEAKWAGKRFWMLNILKIKAIKSLLSPFQCQMTCGAAFGRIRKRTITTPTQWRREKITNGAKHRRFFTCPLVMRGERFSKGRGQGGVPRICPDRHRPSALRQGHHRGVSLPGGVRFSASPAVIDLVCPPCGRLLPP